MHDLQMMAEEKGVLRWGGLAGILGSIILLAVFVIVGVFVGAGPAEPAGWVQGFPGLRVVRRVEESLYLLVLILWLIHFLALYRALRRTSLAPALFGSVLGILGLVILMVGALPHAGATLLSDLYHAPDATAVDQATLVLLWQANQSLFEAFLIEGLALLPIGLVALGAAMLGAPAFGKGFGAVSIALGLAGGVAASVLLFEPRSAIAVVGILALIIFHFILGWKAHRLSKAL